MRAIETERFSMIEKPASLGPAPDLRWLPIEQLRVDPAYQREITPRGQSHVRKIAEAFDWRLFSAVVVSPVPGGFFAIIDGQHRTTAAALCGQDSVPCQIIQADPVMQARAFEAINGRKINVTRDQRYKAALAAGDEGALRVERLTRAAGIRMLTYTPSGATMKAGDCLAHSPIAKLCAAFPDGKAQFALLCLRAAAGDIAGRAAINTPFILATLQAFEDHPKWFGRGEVVSAFEEFDPETEWSRAAQRVANTRGLTLRDCLAASIIELVERAFKAPGGGGKPMAEIIPLSSVRRAA